MFKPTSMESRPPEYLQAPARTPADTE
jgi:hypothetical protein